MRRTELYRCLMEQFPVEYHPHLQRFPLNYLTEVCLDDIPVHMDILRSLGENEDECETFVHARILGDGDYKIVLGLRDQPFVMHTISCLFASLLVSVKEAHLFSTKDGLVLDIFVVSSEMEMYELRSCLEKKLSEDVRSSRLLLGNINHLIENENNSRLLSPCPESSPAMSQLLSPNELLIQNKVYDSPNSLIYSAFVKSAPNSDLIAVKYLNDALKNSPTHKKEFINEIKINRQLNHPNIVKFIGCNTQTPEIFLVTEFLMGGSLYDIIHLRVGKVPLPSSRIARDIASAMEYLHSFNFIHRDLKSQNILFDSLNNNFKVSDFGVTRRVGEPMTKEAGSYRWMAPEVLSHQNYTLKVDVYSFGMVLWELVAREIPFKHMSPIQAAIAVSQEGRRPKIPLNCNPRISDLIRVCWANNPKERPSFTQVLRHLDGLDIMANHSGTYSSMKQKLFSLFSAIFLRI